MMKTNRMKILTLLVCVVLCLAGICNKAIAAESVYSMPKDYYDAVNAFIENNNWKDDASYGSAQGPKSDAKKTHPGILSCYAYVTDFSYEVWKWPKDASDYRPNHVIGATKFTSEDEIMPGDVLYYDYDGNGKYPHWYVVLDRYTDGTLWTAEGNYSGKANVSKNTYNLKNGKKNLAMPYNRDNDDGTTTKLSREFRYGFHMPDWLQLDNTHAGKYFNVTVDKGYIREGYYEVEEVVHTASKYDAFKIRGSKVNSYDHTWYYVEYADNKYGWIFSERGEIYKPKTKTVKYVYFINGKFFAPVHDDYYGKATTIAQAMEGETVTIVNEVVNKHDHLWYHVQFGNVDGWLWSDYTDVAEQKALNYYSQTGVHQLIENPEAGMCFSDFTIASSGNCFDVEGAAGLNVISGASSIDDVINASSMKSISIPTSVTSIGANAFSKCTALTTVNYAGTQAQWKAIASGSGNANLTNAKIVYSAEPASTAAFTSVTATPATTNAMLRATVTVTSGSGKFTGSGIRVYNSSGTTIASKDETHSYNRSASGTSSYNIWYDITDELGKTLTANTTYSYQFYTIFNGTKIWSEKKSFKTAGTSMNFTYTLESVTEDSFTFSFKGTASKKGKFSEFGCKLVDLNTGATKMDYSNTTDENLNKPSAQWFSIDSWELSGTSGHTYSMQLYYVFDGVKYSSSVYTISFPDNTAPVISDVEVLEASANGYMVSCSVTDNNEVADVQFATWSTNNGKDDLVYHDRGTVDGSTWTCLINIGDGHNNESNCTYATQIIATDKHGNQKTHLLNQYVDSAPPVISNVVAEPLYNGRYKVTCTVTDNHELDTVKAVSNFSTGTATTSTTGSSSENTYTFTVNTANIGKKTGYYTTRIYAYDTSDNLTTQSVFLYVDAISPTISDIQISNITSYGFDISCQVTDDANGVAKVQFPAWTAACADGSGDAQDDLADDWQTNAIYAGTLTEDGRWVGHVSSQDHNNEQGTYYVRAYAWDGFGNTAYVDRKIAIGSGTVSAGKRASGTLGNHVYTVYAYDDDGNMLTWEEARAECESMGGTLATITSAEENAFVTELLNASGLEQTNSYGYQAAWLGAEGTGSGYRWITDEEFEYTNWNEETNQPRYTRNTYAMTLWSDGSWGTEQKEGSFFRKYTAAYICEYEKDDVSGLATLELPANLTEIGAEAFAGTAAQVVVLPAGCTSVGSRAFADSPSLRYVVVSSRAAVDIAEDAFSGSSVTVIEK